MNFQDRIASHKITSLLASYKIKSKNRESVWDRIRTFEEYVVCKVAYLSGLLKTQPLNGDLNPDSVKLMKNLKALNMAGFATHDGQGRVSSSYTFEGQEYLYNQRPYVAGFMRTEMFEALITKLPKSIGFVAFEKTMGKGYDTPKYRQKSSRDVPYTRSKPMKLREDWKVETHSSSYEDLRAGFNPWLGAELYENCVMVEFFIRDWHTKRSLERVLTRLMRA
jgi:hypothetical protein